MLYIDQMMQNCISNNYLNIRIKGDQTVIESKEASCKNPQRYMFKIELFNSKSSNEKLNWKIKACKKCASLHLDCSIIQTSLDHFQVLTVRVGAHHIDNRFKKLVWTTQHVHLAFLLWYCWWCSGGRHPPYWPPSPSAFSVSWKMIPAHWLNFIPSWPGPFCEGAINLGLNTTFVYYSGKALMTFMSMITTFFWWGENALWKAKIHCDQTHMSCITNLIC